MTRAALPSSNARQSVGWQCKPCGWTTFALDDMHRFVNWPNPDGSISLVCPRCGAEGQFIDAFRGDTMPAYVKKPVVIEAVQVKDAIECNRTWPQYLTPWLEEARDSAVLAFHDRHVTIQTLEGQHRGDWDDWIIQGVKGELYPCKPDIFEATYDVA